MRRAGWRTIPKRKKRIEKAERAAERCRLKGERKRRRTEGRGSISNMGLGDRMYGEANGELLYSILSRDYITLLFMNMFSVNTKAIN